MFRAFFRPSSGAHWLQWQSLVLSSYRGDSRISVRLLYQFPYKTPATISRQVVTFTLLLHNSRDSSDSTVVRLHNELLGSDGFISGNGSNRFSCTVYTKILLPTQSTVQWVVQIGMSRINRAGLQNDLHLKPNFRICGALPLDNIRLYGVVLNPLNPELIPICYLLALLAHHFHHVSRIRVKSLTLRLLMSYIYIYIFIYIYIYIWSAYSWCF